MRSARAEMGVGRIGIHRDNWWLAGIHPAPGDTLEHEALDARFAARVSAANPPRNLLESLVHDNAQRGCGAPMACELRRGQGRFEKLDQVSGRDDFDTA